MILSALQQFFLACWFFLSLVGLFSTYLYSYQNLNYSHSLTLFPSEKPGSLVTTLGLDWNPQPILGIHYFGDFQSIIGESILFDSNFNYYTVDISDSPFTYFLGMILANLSDAIGLSTTFFSLLIIVLTAIYLRAFSYSHNLWLSFWIFVISISSMGLLFAVDRGNFWLISGLFVYLGSYSRWTRKQDIVYLALAIAIKPPLIILAFLIIIRNREYRKIFTIATVFLIIQATSLVFLLSTLRIQTIYLQMYSYFFNIITAYFSRSDTFLSYPTPPNHLGIRTSLRLLLEESSLFDSNLFWKFIEIFVIALTLGVFLGLLKISLSNNSNFITLILGTSILITYFLGGNGYSLIILISGIAILFSQESAKDSTIRPVSNVEVVTLALCSCPIFIPFAFKFGNPTFLTFIIPILMISIIFCNLFKFSEGKFLKSSS